MKFLIQISFRVMTIMKTKELKNNWTIHITKTSSFNWCFKTFLWIVLIKRSPPNFSWSLKKFPAINQFQLSSFYMKYKTRLKRVSIRKSKIFLFLDTALKMKFSINDIISKCDQIRSFLWIWSHLLKKFLT